MAPGLLLLLDVSGSGPDLSRLIPPEIRWRSPRPELARTRRALEGNVRDMLPDARRHYLPCLELLLSDNPLLTRKAARFFAELGRRHENLTPRPVDRYALHRPMERAALYYHLHHWLMEHPQDLPE